ncbi:MAG: hypothetical protein AB7I59_26655 [Geminicoccaceae bacterium]
MSGNVHLSPAFRYGLTLLLVSGLGPPGGSWAQTDRGLDFFTPGSIGGDAYLQRQVRALDANQRGGSLSSSQLRQSQRDLITQSKGVDFTPEQGRIQRDLDRIQQQRSWQATTGKQSQPPALPQGERLPGTVGDMGGLPSFNGAMTVSRLLGRAQEAIDAGRTHQARSDLATAHSLAGGLSPQSDADRATVAEFQARMADLTRRLGDG